LSALADVAPCTDLDTAADAQAWLYEEARLLDERRFDAWLARFADDLRYWVPAGPASTDPERAVSFVYDDRARLQERIQRAESSAAHCEDPPTRTCRLVTNVELTWLGDEGRRLRSNVAIATTRRGEGRTYIGTVVHELLRTDGRWLVTRREVHLLDGASRLPHLPWII
jgi:3-phenylpropionate/cinnamic acid dioxygenase small subunit